MLQVSSYDFRAKAYKTKTVFGPKDKNLFPPF